MVDWAEVRAAIAGLVCVAAFPDGQGGVRELPVQGNRELCKLPPPATALERAMTNAFVAANEVIRAWPEEHRRSQEAVAAATDPTAKLVGARSAFFSERVVAVLARRIGPALAAEGLRCSDCPTPPAVTPRTVAWAELAPYLAAYVWPDPVVTPRGADGKPSGEPQGSVHMCGGINGIARMTKVDEDLRFTALLTAFATEAVFERVPAIFDEVRTEPAYVALPGDDAKTEYLRAQLGPRVAADPAVRAGICASLQRFADDTPIRVAECSQ
ncbi:MAG TPA: hypothetical protein VG755_21825 [Nannocystaceae bacterium]|nr:hypothetical protein [Nannocystaceae bacterium]